MWFHNIKLMKKLMFTFLVVVLILIVQGGLSLNHLRTMKGLSANLYQQTNILQALNNLQVDVLLSRLTVFRHIVEVEEEEMEKIKAKAIKNQETLQKSFEQVEFYELTLEENVLFKKMGGDWQTLQADYQKVIQSSSDYAKEESVEAMVFNQNTFDQINEALEQLILTKEKQVQLSYERGLAVVQTSQITTLLTILVGLAIASFFGIVIARTTTNPIKKVTALLEKMSQGNLKERSGWVAQDETGQMAQSLDQFAKNLNSILFQVQLASNEVAEGSKGIASSSHNFSQGASSQASAIEEISVSMDQLEAQTQKNAENATAANQLATSAKHNVDEGNHHMQDMMDAMTEIADSNQQISKIIKIIDEIAFQTNLLALNAAVEAARAGVHGKGFAVVANEVRNLAVRSANAAKETTELIEHSVQTVSRGRTVTKNTADALEKTVSSIQTVTNLVTEIDHASQEQTQGLSQIREGLIQLNEVIQQNVVNSDQSASTAQTLSEQANNLYSHLKQFDLQTDEGGEQEAATPLKLAENIHPVEPAQEALPEKPSTESIIALDDDKFGKF